MKIIGLTAILKIIAYKNKSRPNINNNNNVMAITINITNYNNVYRKDNTFRIHVN